MLFSLGFFGTFLLNNFLKETYNSRKSDIEERIENLIDKKVYLGDYSGIRFLGISLENSKIIDKRNLCPKYQQQKLLLTTKAYY